MRTTALASFAAASMFAAVLLAVACDEGGDESDAVRSRCIVDAMATATAQPEPSTDYRDWLPGDDEARCLLRKVLLDPDLLPDGLGEFAQTLSGGAESCGVIPPPVGYGVGLEANDLDHGRGFRQQAWAFADGQAVLVLEAVRHSCSLLMRQPKEESRYEPLSIGTWGDETYAILERIPLGDVEALEFARVLIRRDNVLSSISTIGMNELAIRALVSRAADQLDAAGPIAEPTPHEDECDLRKSRRGPGVEVLANALLRLEDFPDRGWVELIRRDCSIPEDAYCDGENPLRLPPPATYAPAAFASRGSYIVDARVYRFASGTLDDAMATYSDPGRNAGSCVRTVDDGEHRWSFGPLSAPPVGDASGAFFLRWNGPGDPNDDTSQAARSVMVVRVGDTVAAVSIPAMYDRAGVNDEAPTDLVELALRAHERLVAIQDELD